MKQNSSPDTATYSWQQASSDTDPRSSGNGLLSIAYGNLEIAARNGWNTEQSIISDSDLAILLTHSQSTQTPAEIQPALKAFIKNNLQEDWSEYDDMTHAQRQDIAISLVNIFARTVLNNADKSRSASLLLFFLCPQLPIFPATEESEMAADTYPEYYLKQKHAFTLALPSLDQGTPQIHYGNEQEQDIIRKLLAANNWWQRYLFIHSKL